MKYIKELVRAEADKAHAKAAEIDGPGTFQQWREAKAAAYALEELYRKLLALPSSAWRD